MTTWKQTERRIAKLVGGERVPITGRQRGDAPDIKHDWLSLEVKHRKKLPEWLHDAMDQAIKSKTPLDPGKIPGGVLTHIDRDKLPMAILHENGKHNSYCVIRLSDFIEWFI